MPEILGSTRRDDLIPTEETGACLSRILAENVGLARRSYLSTVSGGLGTRRRTDRAHGAFGNQDSRDAAAPPYTPASAAIGRILVLPWSYR